MRQLQIFKPVRAAFGARLNMIERGAPFRPEPSMRRVEPVLEHGLAAQRTPPGLLLPEARMQV